jgi:hypothetical protein
MYEYMVMGTTMVKAISVMRRALIIVFFLLGKPLALFNGNLKKE